MGLHHAMSLPAAHSITNTTRRITRARRVLWAALVDQLGYMWLIPLYRRLVAAHASHPSRLKNISYGSPAGHTLDVYLPAAVAQCCAQDSDDCGRGRFEEGGSAGSGAGGDGRNRGVSGGNDFNADSEKAPRNPPVALFVHGGAWEHGGKELYATVGQTLAARGFVAVVVNHTKFNDGSLLGKPCVDDNILACVVVGVPCSVLCVFVCSCVRVRACARAGVCRRT